ncbi:MAG: hydroxymethylglutaryl-CoA synthase family protein [Myxococcaceae bacterium]
MRARVGIEAVGLAVPHRYIEIEDLATARGVDPKKYTVGLGARQMAVAEPGEDTVALAATAAARVLAQGVRREEIGMLAVGTETGVDHSKPVASFVHGLLQLPANVRTFDVQHACFGGTAALMSAVEWIASGVGAGRRALVICADLARYGARTAGEPTQGGGAVALLVSAQPEVLELDLGLSGNHSAHVHDFWRPIGSRDALVDGHYSVECYLQAVSGAYRTWRQKAVASEVLRSGTEVPSEQLSRLIFHVPFCKMARKAHAQVRRVDLEDRLGRKLELQEEEVEATAAAESFRQQVEPSLDLCARIGNAYTAALYLGLTGLLQSQAEMLVGQRLGFFSYGSGCSSEFFSGVVGKNASARMAATAADALLDRRERVSIDEYERILALPSDAVLQGKAPEGEFRFAGVQENRRVYSGGSH